MNSHLTRNERERCVMARVQRQRVRRQQNFSLKHYGSWEAAETAAHTWIDSVLPTLPAIITSKNRMTPRNHSGVVGVHFDSGRRTLPSGTVADYPGYVARWPGCKAGLRWSFNTYNGEDNAFVHACLCRQMETKDREAVEEAVRTLSPAARDAWLARQHPAQPV
ncbi:MAG: hypothetical protein WC661_08950 [Opitutaceae bacterium]|jgi:hypothetical protein